MSAPFVVILGTKVWLRRDFPWSWELCFGPEAPINRWHLEPGLAAEVLRHRVIDVELNVDGVATPIKNVIIIGEDARPDKYRRVVKTADARWPWKFRTIRRSWNVAARSGRIRRVVDGTGLREEVDPLVPEIDYRLYSVLPGDKPVKPAFAVKDVFQELCDFSSRWMKRDVKLVSQIGPRGNSYPPIELRDKGPAAAGRLLARVGMANVKVRLDGSVVVGDVKPGDEIPIVREKIKVDPEHWGKLTLLDLANERPDLLEYGWVMDAEIRSDSDASVDPSTLDPDDPWHQQVIYVTDDSLKLRDGTTADTGQVIPLSDYLPAIQDLADYPTPPGPLTETEIQAKFNGPDLEFEYGGSAFDRDTSEKWRKRITEVESDYRQLEQVNPRFISYCVPGSVKAVRAAYADPVTRKRTPSPVFIDYCEVPTLRELDTNSQYHGWNQDSFPWKAGVTAQEVGEKTYEASYKLEDLTAAPCDLGEEDTDIGVFRLEMRLDQHDRGMKLIPSRLLNLPTVPLSGLVAPTAVQNIEACALTAGHRITFVFTATPGGPNDERQWYRVAIKPADAFKRLGIPAQKCSGPPLLEPVGERLDKARIPWDDDQKAQIVELFTGKSTGAINIRPANLAQLQDASTAFAAGFLFSYLDHYVGTESTLFDPTLEPVGSIHTVVFGFDEAGGFRATVNAIDPDESIDVESFMADSTRRTLYEGELR